MYYLHKDFLITTLSSFCSPKLHDGKYINDTTQWFCYEGFHYAKRSFYSSRNKSYMANIYDHKKNVVSFSIFSALKSKLRQFISTFEHKHLFSDEEIRLSHITQFQR